MLGAVVRKRAGAQVLGVGVSLKFQGGSVERAVHGVPGRWPNSLLDKLGLGLLQGT